MRHPLLASLAAFPLLVATGCSSSSPPGGHADAGPDLAFPADLSRPGTMAYRYVVNAITLPQNKFMFAADLNNDGTTDNAFGSLVKTLKSLPQPIDLQAEENAIISKGDGLNLLALVTGDPTLTSDPYASVRAYTAQSQYPPDFTGNGTFQVDTQLKAAGFDGPLSGGTFRSNDPLFLTAPPTIYLHLVLYPGVSVDMPVVGARIAFSPSMTGLTDGQLNGAIAETAINEILIPAVQQTLDMIAHNMPCDSNCMQVLQMFDTNHDGTISLMEVQNNSLVTALLGPDVQLFDAQGNWHPDPTNGNKDSLSLGVGFQAVKATFTEPAR
jgi:hypothetical protein